MTTGNLSGCNQPALYEPILEILSRNPHQGFTSGQLFGELMETGARISGGIGATLVELYGLSLVDLVPRPVVAADGSLLPAGNEPPRWKISASGLMRKQDSGSVPTED